jgi:hypothetical protein
MRNGLDRLHWNTTMNHWKKLNAISNAKSIHSID